MSSDPYKNPGTYSAGTRIPAFPRGRSYKPFGGPHSPIAARPKGMRLPSMARHPVLEKSHAKTAQAVKALAKKGTRFTREEQQALRGISARKRYVAKGGFIKKNRDGSTRKG
jgi:hypothetical protein